MSSHAPVAAPPGRFGPFAWAVLLFNVGVILGGSVVRATGSGAGCGETWPKCDGSIIPIDPAAETVIEFTHRATSFFAGVGVLALVVWAFRRFARGHRVRRAAVAAGGFILLEGLIGASLVVFGWVEDDASWARAVMVTIHLANTFLLLGALTLTAWWGSGGPAVAAGRDRGLSRILALAGAGILVIGATGALNALADTLFPAGSVLEGIREEFGPSAPWLVRLRVVHPVLAVATGIGIAASMMSLLPDLTGRTRTLARLILAVIGAQFVVGLVNVALLTPLETQLVHLAMADGLWIAFVVFAASALAVPAPEEVAV